MTIAVIFRVSEVDPVGNAIRKAATIQRRQYRVESANAMWHLDTHMSLER